MTNRQRLAIQLSAELMKQHGLSHWKFRFSRSRVNAGMCLCNSITEPGVLVMSKFLPDLNPDEVIVETIKHEIAHAIAYMRWGERGHGPPWKEACRLVGAKPERLARDVILYPYWEASCPNCHCTYYLKEKPELTTPLWCASANCGTAGLLLGWKQVKTFS